MLWNNVSLGAAVWMLVRTLMKKNKARKKKDENDAKLKHDI